MALDKVVDSAELDAGMAMVADTIRAKAGTTDPLMWPDGFSEAIAEIMAGGGNLEPAFRATVTVDEEQTATVNNLFVIESTFATDLKLEDSGAASAFDLSSKRQRFLAMQVKKKTRTEKIKSVAICNSASMLFFFNGVYYLRATVGLSLYSTDAENNLYGTASAVSSLNVGSITGTSVNLNYTNNAYSAQLEAGDYDVVIYDLGGVDFDS